MRQRTLLYTVALALLAHASMIAQAPRPVVMMTITPAGEPARHVSAPESDLARIKLKDGTEFGFRPTIQDSSPWTRVLVTVFRMDPQVETLGEVELKTGGPAVASKTKPVFTIAVTKVSEKS